MVFFAQYERFARSWPTSLTIISHIMNFAAKTMQWNIMKHCIDKRKKKLNCYCFIHYNIIIIIATDQLHHTVHQSTYTLSWVWCHRLLDLDTWSRRLNSWCHNPSHLHPLHSPCSHHTSVIIKQKHLWEVPLF